MPTIPMEQIQRRLTRDNPWWETPKYRPRETNLPRRLYFKTIQDMAKAWKTQRAPVILGTRRVGKTVILKQLVAELLDDGFDPSRIMYVSLDTPTYHGMGLEEFLDLMPDFAPETPHFVIFDEVQYLKNWEVHLKSLVDSYPDSKFIVSGSAAAALKLKSQESGAGRFSDILLPPLTFYEFLDFQAFAKGTAARAINIQTIGTDMAWLNARFVEYLNFGGFPEVASGKIDPGSQDQLIADDIVEKVLLRDIPNLYGVQDSQALNRMFTHLAYNSGNEVNIEQLSSELEMSKPTFKKYFEYLEAAFLIMKIPRIDDNAKSLSRERNFKVHLSNPSMWAALFDRIDPTDSVLLGRLAESAFFAQWQHAAGWKNARYARWKSGEVDFVVLSPGKMTPLMAIEIKWSNKTASEPARTLAHLIKFGEKHGVKEVFATSRSEYSSFKNISIVPVAAMCAIMGLDFAQKSTNTQLGLSALIASQLRQ